MHSFIYFVGGLWEKLMYLRNILFWILHPAATGEHHDFKKNASYRPKHTELIHESKGVTFSTPPLVSNFTFDL